jgi:hypothetical protein
MICALRALLHLLSVRFAHTNNHVRDGFGPVMLLKAVQRTTTSTYSMVVCTHHRCVTKKWSACVVRV